MRIYYYRGTKPNFGDDLNEVLWPELLPAAALAAEGITMIGIGSILTEEWVGSLSADGERVVVVGSGTSYDLPPKRIADWTVAAVRGPLTANLIGRPEAAVTDGAILLAEATALHGAERKRDEVLFMPHHRSVRRTPWAELCAEAGLRYVSPQWSVAEVLDAYAGARLVVTEAMHGAIVADTLRIPWVPVTVAPTVDEFKWRDWCLSMAVPYEPSTVPAGDGRDALRYRRMERVLTDRSLGGHDLLGTSPGPDEVADYFARRFSPETKRALLQADRGGRAGRVQGALAAFGNRSARAAAVASLRSAANRRPVLSTDERFTSRLDRMRDALGEVARLAEAGS